MAAGVAAGGLAGYGDVDRSRGEAGGGDGEMI